LPQKSLAQSANSGRLIVAQQFTAGKSNEVNKSVKRTADQKGLSNVIGHLASAVRFTDFTSMLHLTPAINRWATFSRPLFADWTEKTFGATPRRTIFLNRSLNRSYEDSERSV